MTEVEKALRHELEKARQSEQRAHNRAAELNEDVRIWKGEAERRSEAMIDLNLDRAAMGVQIARLKELVDAACTNTEVALTFLRKAGRPGLADSLAHHPEAIRAEVGKMIL